MDRDDQDLRSESEPGDAPRRLDSVHAGQRQVHDDDVRLQGLSLLHRFLAGRCLAHDLHVFGLLEQRPQAGAHDRVVVDQEYPHDRSRPRSSSGPTAGTVTRIVVPRPGAVSTVRPPPTSAARSCILVRPE